METINCPRQEQKIHLIPRTAIVLRAIEWESSWRKFVGEKSVQVCCDYLPPLAALVGAPEHVRVEVFERKNHEVHAAELRRERGVVRNGAIQGEEGIEKPREPKSGKALRAQTVS